MIPPEEEGGSKTEGRFLTPAATNVHAGAQPRQASANSRFSTRDGSFVIAQSNKGKELQVKKV